MALSGRAPASQIVDLINQCCETVIHQRAYHGAFACVSGVYSHCGPRCQRAGGKLKIRAYAARGISPYLQLTPAGSASAHLAARAATSRAVPLARSRPILFTLLATTPQTHRHLAQFERSLTQERVKAGLAAALHRGRRGGRPAAIDTEKLAAIVTALDGGATKAARRSDCPGSAKQEAA